MIRMRTRTFVEINSNATRNSNDRKGNGWNDGSSKKESRIGETPSSGSTAVKISVSGRIKARAIERRDVSITVAGLTTEKEDASLWEDQMIRMRIGCKKIPRCEKWFFEQMREGVGE